MRLTRAGFVIACFPFVLAGTIVGAVWSIQTGGWFAVPGYVAVGALFVALFAFVWMVASEMS